MINFYLVSIGSGVDLVITENAVIINNFSESRNEYDNFEFAVFAMTIATGNELSKLKLTDEEQRVVFNLLDTNQEPAAIKYIRVNGVPA